MISAFFLTISCTKKPHQAGKVSVHGSEFPYIATVVVKGELNWKEYRA